MRARPGAQALAEDDLELLQYCFDIIVARNQIDRASDAANVAAKSLFDAYAAGIGDREELIRIGEAALAQFADTDS